MVAKAEKQAQGGKEVPKRLTPTPEVLRQLYLQSGNNCAMPNCKHLIVDSKGVIIGQICHIEAASPGGARFNENMTNEERRAESNLVLMCNGHHKQIDSKEHEKEFTLSKVRSIKKKHEAKFKGIGLSLQKSFQTAYVDSTQTQAATGAGTCKRIEEVVPDCKIDDEQAEERKEQIADYLERLSRVPEVDRDFMRAVIDRSIFVGNTDGILVHVDDARDALGASVSGIRKHGSTFKRFGIGDVDLYSTDQGEEPHIMVLDPSDYVPWSAIQEFCEKTGTSLEEFVIDLNFGLLD
ncbi:hypothetical protein [Sphingopyxis granuli]|uniref:hypothetical protein n=1 Tax=Sphingopyxis granuli TaxID=267128 RepID=UPI00301E2807